MSECLKVVDTRRPPSESDPVALGRSDPGWEQDWKRDRDQGIIHAEGVLVSIYCAPAVDIIRAAGARVAFPLSADKARDGADLPSGPDARKLVA